MKEIRKTEESTRRPRPSFFFGAAACFSVGGAFLGRSSFDEFPAYSFCFAMPPIFL